MDNNIKDLHKKNSSFKFTAVTYPFEMVEDESLIGESKIRKVRYEPTVDSLQTTFLVRENKSTSILHVHTRDSWKDEFKSFMNILHKYSIFPLVECGKSSMQRDVIVVDIDYEYDLWDIFNRLRIINDLPECVISQHKSTKHWQIQFYLSESICTKYIDLNNINENGKHYPVVVEDEINKAKYIRCVKRMTKYFKDVFNGTDSNYQGTLFRNPWSDSQELSLLVRHGKLISLRESRPIGTTLEKLNEFLDNNGIVLRRNTSTKYEEYKERLVEKSRHKLTMVYAREWIWENMRNGYTPTEDELFEYLVNKREEIGELCEKDPHEIKEIKSQIKSLYKWSVDNFVYCETGGKQWENSIRWNKNQRAAKIKRAKKLKKLFQECILKGMNYGEIAKEFGISRVTLYSYIALFYVMDMVETSVFDKDKRFFGLKLWEEIIAEIGNKIKLLKAKFGNSKIKWKLLNIDYTLDEFYDIPLEGNYSLDKEIA